MTVADPDAQPQLQAPSNGVPRASTTATESTSTPRGDRIQLDVVTPNNINLVRKLNAVMTTNARFNDRFYKEVLAAGDLSQMVYFNDVPVGVVCAVVRDNEVAHAAEEKADASTPATTSYNPRHVYICTLAVLSPYRRRGMGRT